MKILEDMNQCCGCGSCKNICPVNAISMQMNAEGFLEPFIDDTSCINCGACKKSCPILNKVSDNWDNPRRYAFTVAEEDLLKRSSSGAAFTILAEEIIKNGGAVVGATYTENLDVHHVVIDDIKDLDQLRLSKYVQSNQEDCYSKTKKLLENGVTVLYTGCPCQIAGLKSFLNGKKYSNLYTVDLLCHSVPSPKLYKEHLENTYDIEKVSGIEMRNRDGWQSCFNVIYKDGSIEKHKTRDNIFQKMFHKALISRRSCYNCQFSYLPRYGDFTIGDNWNAKKLKLGLPYEKKSSLVLINNERALSFWNQILSKTIHNIQYKDLTETCSIKLLNKNVYAPMVTDKELQNRNKFYENYKEMSLERAAYKTLYKYDVGLILYMSDNYGSCATNYALYKAIEELGFAPIILDHLVAPSGVSARFAKEHLALSGDFMEAHDYKGANLMCDAFVVGSDQSLRWDFPIVMNNLEYILLEFADENKRKIGYAVSFGPERYTMDETIQKLYTYALNRFDGLSVREDYAVNMCEKNFNSRADWVVDPVYLVGKESYLEIAQKSSLKFNESYVLVYIRHATEDKKLLIQTVKQKMGIKIIVITDAEKHGSLKTQLGIEDIIDKVEFVDWIAYFANASYVITDSFHGTCFSLIFEKKYVSLKAGTTQRFDSLANMLGSADDTTKVQIFEDVKPLINRTEIFKELNYEEIREKIAEKRKECIQWLNNALHTSPRSCEVKADILIDYAKLVKNKFNNDVVKRYGYDEQIRTQRETYIKAGKTYLEAQKLLNNEAVHPADPITKIESVEEYFSTLSKAGKYTIIICGKDTCAVHFKKFMDKSKLPLKKEPKVHNSYIAIISENQNVYEELSDKPLRKKCVLNPGHQTLSSYYIDEDVWKEYSSRNTQPLYVDIVSLKYDRKLQNQKAIISINNVNYALDRRGVNIVVIDNFSNCVVDSLRIDLHADANLKMQRK